jgi:hypothetical protein
MDYALDHRCHLRRRRGLELGVNAKRVSRIGLRVQRRERDPAAALGGMYPVLRRTEHGVSSGEALSEHGRPVRLARALIVSH